MTMCCNMKRVKTFVLLRRTPHQLWRMVVEIKKKLPRCSTSAVDSVSRRCTEFAAELDSLRSGGSVLRFLSWILTNVWRSEWIDLLEVGGDYFRRAANMHISNDTKPNKIILSVSNVVLKTLTLLSLGVSMSSLNTDSYGIQRGRKNGQKQLLIFKSSHMCTTITAMRTP